MAFPAFSSPPPRPAVSVVIPAFNSDRFLSQALDSVFAQTFSDHEVLVIDDGSTDTTPELVQRYSHHLPAHHQPRLRYVRQSNQGVSVARNHGIQLARGQAIAFLDADDWWVPTKLERQYERLMTSADMVSQKIGCPKISTPEIGMVHSGWQRVAVDGTPQTTVRPWHHCPQLTLNDWLEWKPVLPSAMMVRRQWLLRADGFDPGLPLAEDTDLMVRLAAMGCHATWLKAVTVYYRQHGQSAMHNGLAQARSLTTVIDRLFARPDLPASTQRNEREIRFSTWVWIAWNLYHTGNEQAMAPYLVQAWAWSLHPPIDTLTLWVESFAHFSKQWGQTLDTEQLCQSHTWQQVVRQCLAG